MADLWLSGKAGIVWNSRQATATFRKVFDMSAHGARRWGVGLGGGAAVAAAMLGIGVVHADGSNDLFTTPLSTIGLPGSLSIQDNWLPGIEEVSVAAGKAGNSSLALLVPAVDGDQVVDLFNHTRGDAPPLFNPDATGPIEVGGLPLASPNDGALLNNLFDAAFLGDTADWGKVATLFGDWLGIDPSGAAGGAAAAMLGVGAAYADNDDPMTLLDTANADTTEAIDVLNKIPNTVDIYVGGTPAEMFDWFEAIQRPLLSSDNSFLSGLANLLFDGPDQQLEQASEKVLTAAQGVAADPSSMSANFELSSVGLQDLNATVDVLLPNVVGDIIDKLFDFDGFDTASGSAAAAVDPGWLPAFGF